MLGGAGDSSLSYRARMSARPEIRPVRPDEYAVAGEVTAAAYLEFAQPDRPAWVEYLRRIADIAGRAERTPVLVALLDGAIVGSVTIELDDTIESSRLQPMAPDEAHLRMLGVHPGHRRQGIGRALVEASMVFAIAHGRDRMTLETTERMRAAQAMYEAMGFTPMGRREVEPGLVFLDYERRLPSSSPAP